MGLRDRVDDYFRSVSDEAFLKALRRAGCILVPVADVVVSEHSFQVDYDSKTAYSVRGLPPVFAGRHGGLAA
jgi:hypothetical protein